MPPLESLALGELPQNSEEVGHSFALAWLALLDGTEGDALLCHLAGLLEELGESTAAQTAGPPQPGDRLDRGLDVVVAERHGRGAYAIFDVQAKARGPLVLTLAHWIASAFSTTAPVDATPLELAC